LRGGKGGVYQGKNVSLKVRNIREYKKKGVTEGFLDHKGEKKRSVRRAYLIPTKNEGQSMRA